MKRICVYVTFDYENIADDYIGYMLKELRKAVDYLVVVCNYGYIAKGIENVQPFADRIFYRENIGFDAGAYKDVFCRYLGWDMIGRYDELLLINDSFYGPFYLLSDLFCEMEGTNADYWGMTRSPEVEREGHIYGSHIQSYFIAMRKRVLQNEEFQAFWENMAYPESLEQAIVSFEIGLNVVLKNLGFKGASVMEQCLHQWALAKNENPYMLYPLELIRDARIPFLKRKCLYLGNKGFAGTIEALQFIKNECGYDIDLIKTHLLRISKDTDFMGLEKFYAGHSKIFIYGAGLYGRNLAKYFEYKGWRFEKFLVTSSDNQPQDCLCFEQADIAENDGIIIAVGNKEVFYEILSLVKKRCSIKQIFNMEYGFS